MQDTNGNPDELAQRLSKATGIPIVKWLNQIILQVRMLKTCGWGGRIGNYLIIRQFPIHT
jgi:hypothetical protein